MKKLIVLFWISLVTFNINAQSIKECAFDDVHQRLLLADSNYLNAYNANQLKIDHRLRSTNINKAGGVYTIPVVVHIIHTGQAVGVGANISQAQINSAIDTLNARYRNSKGLGVDTEIEFRLAQRDPNGNATTGVVRVDGSSVTNYSTEGIGAGGSTGADQVAIKNLSRWPNTQYYNVWVVTEIENNNGGFGIQGYAYFPGAPDSLDGTVIMHTAFGTTGTVNSFNNQNRTFVHEMGHAFALYHTFEGDVNGTTCPSGNGDFVADTDPHIRASSNCPTGSNSCTSGTIDELSENFMNYSSQTCAVKFTSGQKARMRAAIDVARPHLVTSKGDESPAISNVASASCTPSTTITTGNSGIGILEFSLSNITVVSSNTVDEGDYIDQTEHHTINVVNGTSYTVNVETGPANPENVRIFIDYNGDGDFADAGESVFTSNNQQSTHSGTIAIPASGVTTNTLLRLRVISDFASNTISGSCYNPQYGQIEDYALFINSPISVVASETQSVSCNGGNDGIATANPVGGNTPYTYLWSNVAITQTNSSLTAGTYSVTVTDNSGATAVDNVIISEPAVLNLSANVTDVSTNGGNDGAINLSVAGGVTAYTYNWSNTASTQNISGLSAGAYTVTVTDGNACTAILSVAVNQPGVNLLVTGNVTAVSCKNAMDGSIDITAAGGNPPYTYNWSNSATTEDISALDSNWYYVTVTDASAATDSASFFVSEPDSLILTLVETNVSVNGGNDGSINLIVDGGTSPYSYLWNTNDTIQDLNNLSSGTYTVSVTDANNCMADSSAFISQPAVLSVSGTVTDATCNGSSNGSIDITPSGGNSPYTFLWSNNATTEDLNNISAGSYTVTVTDANSATTSATYTVNQPNAISISLSKTDILCNGDNTGTIIASVSSGTTPYTYLWNDNVTTRNRNNLIAGTYTITVTDNNGCTATQAVTINQQPALTVSFTQVNNACNGGNSGSITATISGGTPSYSYVWSNSVNGNGSTSTNSNLTAGTYTITVTDVFGCTTANSTTITAPPSISINVTTTAESCNPGNDGTATANITGGTSPYTYAWSGSPSSSNTANNYAAGNYGVTVSDANGCSSSQTFTINAAPSIAINETVVNASCFGSCDGSITLTPSGGTTPYTYLWNDNTNTSSKSNLCSGTYSVTVNDASGCSATRTLSISEPNQIVVNATVTDVTINGGTNGAINITVNGGTSPYSYLWSNSATTEDISGVSAGTYSVTLTDANGCTNISSYTVTQPAGPLAGIIITEIMYNGPESGTDTSEFIELLNVGNTTVNLNGYSFSQGFNFTFGNDSIQAGQYITIAYDSAAFRNTYGIDADFEWTSGGLSNSGEDIVLKDDFNRTVDSVDYDDATPWPSGSAARQVDGGGASLVLCDSLADNNNGTNWAAAITAVSNKVVNGLQVYANPGVRATCVDPLIASVALDSNASCNGGSNGGLTASAVGGLTPYTYLWSNSASTAAISGLAAGTYTVTVTDNLGTTSIANGTISQPNSLVIGSQISNVTTVNGTDGSIDLTISGGTSPYSFSWNPGTLPSTEDQTNLSAGNYAVTITDANGCSANGSFTVSGPTAVVIALSATSVSCNGGSDGAVIATVSGGTSPYTYNWGPGNPNGQGTSSINNLSAGTYYITVTDANATTEVDSVVVNQPSPLTINGVVTNTSAANATDGSIDITVSGGTPAYAFVWNNSTTTEDQVNLAAGNYSVTVTDANGCTITANYIVIDPPTLANLVISEIMYNPPESGTDSLEYIEIVNTGSTSVNLDGYTFTQGVVHSLINKSIAAGQYFVIAVDSSAFRNVFGFNADDVWISGGLSNGGESIVLTDDFNRTVDSVAYDDAIPWPTGSGAGGPDGGGASIELIDSTLNNNLGSNWRASITPTTSTINNLLVFGSPGTKGFTTSIASIEGKKVEIKFYPNPSRSLLNIQIIQEELIRTRMDLMSINGQLIRSYNLSNSLKSIDLSDLADGIYFMRIENQMHKFILNK